MVRSQSTLLYLRRLSQLVRRLWAVALHHPKALFLAGIIIGSYCGYVLSVVVIEASYRLTNGSVQLIGSANPALAHKLKLDKTIGAYRFNPESITPDMANEADPAKVAALLASQKQQTGGGGKDSKNLYSLDLPINPKEGTKVYDVNSKTSFKLIPEFEMSAGRTEDSRVVYPIDRGGQAVYTVKANGIKEDIVLQKPRGDALSFTYKLELPKTLEARLDARGNLGIYSVNPAVSSAMSAALQAGGPSADNARLKDVQENGTKDFLTYVIPAPTIMQSGDQPRGHQAKASYHLRGDQLTVETTGLETLTYPISIDPSVVVTSTSDFATGNNEGMIQFDTDAISRAQVSGGTTGSWAAQPSFTTARYAHGSVVYNGFLYVMGGGIAGSTTDTVQYAPIASDGTVGTWVTTTSLPSLNSNFGSVVYNGFIYVVGGSSGSGSSSVLYAKIGDDGSVGVWRTTTSLPQVRQGAISLIYNGYIYSLGGWGASQSAAYSEVVYAAINADGTIGTWLTTTSFASARYYHVAAVYNGYMYVALGSGASGASLTNEVQYAPINADGTLGAWVASSNAVPSYRSAAVAIAYKGFLYIIGGNGSSTYNDVLYARINANGSIGSWATASTFTTGRYQHTAVVYNDHFYIMGGWIGGTRLNDVQMATVDPYKTVDMTAWFPTTSFGALGQQSKNRILTRSGHSSVVYNGFIYLIGGSNTVSPFANVDYAPLNADGTVGAWVATTALPSGRAGHASVVYNGYVYAFGGQDNPGAITATSYYAPLNADGTVGTWAVTTALPVASSEVGASIYNGYVYITGGTTATGVFTNQVRYAPLNANGTLGAWASTTNLPANRGIHASMANNGYLYIIGGYESGAATNTVLMAPINANGTVGSWNSTSNLSSPRYYIDAYIYNNYVIVAGGRTTGSVETDSSMYAKINADGTLGAWVTGTSFTNARSNHTTVVNNGFIYITGGWNGSTYYGDVQYAALSAVIGNTQSWQTTTAMNLGVYGHASVVYNNFVYVIGGYGGGVYRNDIRYAPISANGTIGTWTTSPNTMSIVRFNVGAAAYNGYLYATGGQQAAGVFSNTVEYAKINADGTIGAWATSGNAFTTARHGHVTVAYNGKLYIVGGGDSANVALADVKYATLNADGSVGAWTDTTVTTAARDTDGFIYGGRLYILGGVNGTTYSNTVRYATINSDGTLGAWTTSGSSFTNARSRLAATAVNGYIYLSGGGASSYYGDLQYAQINADGSIGSWRSSNSRGTVSGAPTVFAYHTMVAAYGKLFEMGGIDSANTPQTASYTATVNAYALSGMYTRQIDLGQTSTLNSITATGVLPVGQANVMFRVAGSDGVYGAWQLPSSLSGAPLANVRYVMYKVIFDDSLSSDPTALSGRSTINDITVDYAVAVSATLTPENRLRHNKYFDASGSLQPLETQ